LYTSIQEAAHQIALSNLTVYDLFDIFRQSIVRTDINNSLVLSGEIEIDESYFGGKRTGNRVREDVGKILVFGIMEHGRKVRVEGVRKVTGETLLNLKSRW
jgi:transposase